MNFKNNNRLIIGLLVGIIVLASILRFYKLGQVPLSLSWDEAAVGYNAWTTTHYGRDEWGNFLPLVFKSFEDDKHPVHIYLTAISVGILDLSDFTVRLPSALFGVFNVVLLFLLGRKLFNSRVGLLAAFLLAVSPYNLHFSRFNHELNFTIFFFLLGLWLFFQGVGGRKNFLPFSFLSFGITLISYHSAKIVVPSIIFLLVALYFKDLLRVKKQFLISLAVMGFFIFLMIVNPALLGIARAKQTALPKIDLKIISRQYLSHFSPQYLFVSGDKNPRLSSQGSGEFYKVEALFLLIGLLGLLWKRSKNAWIILSWAFLAPVPASLVSEAPHAARAMLMTGSWHLVAAFGFLSIVNLFKKPKIKTIAVIIFLGVLVYEVSGYLRYYYGEYAKRYGIEWQYGMEQVVGYLKEHNGYFQVFVTDARSQPYIFFLYHLKYPLDKFLQEVQYNNTQSRSSNLVYSFNKYHFGLWDSAESSPNPGVLYILTPSEFDGLRYKNIFDVKKIIQYPNGTDAFFLVSYP